MQSKGLSRVFSTAQFKSIKSSALSLRCGPTLTSGKTTALTRWAFVGKMMSLLFNMLLRFVIAFLPSSKRLLILGLQSLFPVVLESKKIKSQSLFTFFPYLPKSNGTVHFHFRDILGRGKARGQKSDPWTPGEQGWGRDAAWDRRRLCGSEGLVLCCDCDRGDGHTAANIGPDSGAATARFERRF